MLSEQQLADIHAYIDGELPSEKRAAIETLIADNPEAQELHREAQLLKQKLADISFAEPDLDTAWRDLSKQLEAPTNRKSRLIYLAPIGAVAAMLALSLIYWPTSTPQPVAQLPSAVELVETDLEESSAIVYIDDASGWTVVWIDTENSQEEPAG